MRKVEVKINIRTSPEKVIAAFTNPDMLKASWFVEKTLIEKKSGGVYTLTWNVTEMASVLFQRESSNHI